MTLDRWLSEQVDSLHSALDDVIDLNRGLADVTLSGVHADLVTRIGDEMDLDAGLAQVVPVAPGLLGGLVALADELSGLPPAERLAARVRLPVLLLVEAQILASHLPRVQSLAKALGQPHALTYPDACADALVTAQGLIQELNDSSVGTPAIRAVAKYLSYSLAGTAHGAASYAGSLASLCRTRLSSLLVDIGQNTSGHLDDTLVAGLVAPIRRILSALTSMVGADLTSADLTGIPLDGVLWSPATQWPPDWQEWVRDNSVRVSTDVFEIRAGAGGTRVPT